MFKFILYLFLHLSLATSFAQSSSQPDVFIITTGGTIASRTDTAMLAGHALIQAIPELTNYGAIEVEEFIRVGSSKMTPVLWLKLLKRIKVITEDCPLLKCIIITHGTDTMEETAFFLNLTHKSEIPIIMVGSMRSSNEISADGPANLLNAVRVGISPEAIGKGVLVVLNENICAARDLRKMHNRRVDAFEATERGFVGSVDPEKVVFFRSPIKMHTITSEFDIYALDSLPSVDIVQDFAGFEPDILDYYLNRPSDGLVVSSFAGGRLSHGITPIFDLPASHKPIIVASSIKGGRIMGTNPEDSPVIISNELPTNKARILLMLALTKTSVASEIQSIFDSY
ncbi:MAG: asparaginase [Bacteroidota bacterium]